MERDYPLGHPAASDYKGEPYTPPIAPHAEDYPHGHPARGGANSHSSSTPDGMHAKVLADHQANVERTREMLKHLREDHTDE